MSNKMSQPEFNARMDEKLTYLMKEWDESKKMIASIPSIHTHIKWLTRSILGLVSVLGFIQAIAAFWK